MFLSLETIKNIVPKSKNFDELELILTIYFIPLSKSIDLFYPKDSVSVQL